MAEIYIPTHLVPEEILNQLKDIAQRLHEQSTPLPTPPPVSSLTPSSSSSTSSAISTSGNVQTIPVSVSKNCFCPSGHVTVKEVTLVEQEVTTQRCGLRQDQGGAASDPATTQCTQLFSTRDAATSQQSHTQEDNEAVRTPSSDRSPSSETDTNQDERHQQTANTSVPPLSHSPHPQTSLPYPQCPANDDPRGQFPPLRVPHQPPDFPPSSSSSTCGADGGDEDDSCLMSDLRHPAAEPATRVPSCPSRGFQTFSLPDSSDDLRRTGISTVGSPSCISLESNGVRGTGISSVGSPSCISLESNGVRGTGISAVGSPSCISLESQRHSRSGPGETGRLIPPLVSTSSERVGPCSPAVLTPPETPKSERKRGEPEIFTFDDLACAQERFRQMVERLQHLQEQRPHRGGLRHLGHPSSLPTTPSYRNLDCPSSAPPFPSHRPSSSSSGPVPFPPSSTLSPQSQQHLPLSHTHLKNRAALVPGSLSGRVQSAPPFQDSQPFRNTDVFAASSPPTSAQSPRSLTEIAYPRKKISEMVRSPTISGQSLASSELPPAQYRDPVLPQLPTHGWSIGTERLSRVTPPDQCLLRTGSPNVFSCPDYPSAELYGVGRKGGLGHCNLPRTSENSVYRRAAAASAAECQQQRREEEDGGNSGGGGGGGGGAVGFREQPTQTLYHSQGFCTRVDVPMTGHALKKGRFDLQKEETRELPLCACATMERNLLQMAESAYKWLRREDSSPADFQRFRSQLAHTNDKLRESMDILNCIRDICDHRK